MECQVHRGELYSSGNIYPILNGVVYRKKKIKAGKVMCISIDWHTRYFRLRGHLQQQLHQFPLPTLLHEAPTGWKLPLDRTLPSEPGSSLARRGTRCRARCASDLQRRRAKMVWTSVPSSFVFSASHHSGQIKKRTKLTPYSGGCNRTASLWRSNSSLRWKSAPRSAPPYTGPCTTRTRP